MSLLSVEAAQRRILKLLSPVDIEIVALAQGRGRVLANSWRSSELPAFDNSSVDGFAARAADVGMATPERPRELQVVGDIPAGIVPRFRIGPGQAARIMTGAPVPKGADVVVMLEDTDQGRSRRSTTVPSHVEVRKSALAGSNIRRRGSDVRKGEKILDAGHILRPQDLALLAMTGTQMVRVSRLPRVAVLSSGNELVPVGAAQRAGEIHDTNSLMLASMIEAAGGRALEFGIARDSKPSIERRLDKAAASGADLIVTSAGVSVGAFDLVREVIKEHGRIHFWRVNVRPGKPLAVGTFRGVPFLGLPGNPVSAFVSFELFIRPAIAKLTGSKYAPMRRIAVETEEAIHSDGRESYLRVGVEERGLSHFARLTGHQGSGNLFSLVQANALLVIPAGVKSLPAGSRAEAWLL